MTADQRFWAKVNKNGPTMAHMTTPCWEWIAFRTPKGYGWFDRGLAHRWAWRNERGEPGKLGVLHACDNRACIRVDHLFLGDNAANNADMMAKGRNRHPTGMASGMNTRPDRRPIGARNGSRLHPETRPRGTDHGMAKLTEDAVRDLRCQFAAGATKATLSRAFGISTPTVTQVVERRTWRHVE